MPELETVSTSLRGIEVVDATTGTPFDLGGLDGIAILVLMRHRH